MQVAVCAGWVLLARGKHLQIRDTLCSNNHSRNTVDRYDIYSKYINNVYSGILILWLFVSFVHMRSWNSTFTTQIYHSTQYHVCFSSNGHHCKRSKMCDTSLVFSCDVCCLLKDIFLTMPQKCHCACWSGLDSGQNPKKKKM